jgi:hypothetical protein
VSTLFLYLDDRFCSFCWQMLKLFANNWLENFTLCWPYFDCANVRHWINETHLHSGDLHLGSHVPSIVITLCVQGNTPLGQKRIFKNTRAVQRVVWNMRHLMKSPLKPPISFYKQLWQYVLHFPLLTCCIRTSHAFILEFFLSFFSFTRPSLKIEHYWQGSDRIHCVCWLLYVSTILW